MSSQSDAERRWNGPDYLDDSEDGNFRGTQFITDLRETRRLGKIIVEPTLHFQRVFAQFERRQRVKFFDYAHREWQNYSGKKSTEIEFAYEILTGWPLDEEWLDEPPEESEAQVRLLESKQFKRQFKAEQVSIAREIATGANYKALALLLVNTLFHDTYDAETFETFFAAALGSAILTPEQATAVATCVAESQSDFRRFEVTAEYLVGDAHTVKRKSYRSETAYSRARAC